MQNFTIMWSKTTSFLGKFAKNHPALGRFVEIAIFSGASYALTAIANGEILSKDALFVAIASALLPALTKRGRDLQK